MHILSQVVSFSPCQPSPIVRTIRWLLRIVLLGVGAYAIYRAEQQSVIQEAQWAAEREAHKEKLRREMDEYHRESDAQMTRIYRSLNNIASYAGLDTRSLQ